MIKMVLIFPALTTRFYIFLPILKYILTVLNTMTNMNIIRKHVNQSNS